MERETIRIGKPVVLMRGDNCTVLQAEIDDAGTKKMLEFAVDEEYGQYLTWERSDSFVVALLYYAMIKQRDIQWETPCNERLIFQLRTYFIPVYAREMAFMHRVELSGPTTTELLPSKGGVATGISNGVDSCYTVHKYLQCEYPEYRLTHLLFTDWFLARNTKQYKEEYIAHYMGVLPECAKELGLELIYVRLNIDEQFSIGHFQDKVCGLIQDAGLHSLKYSSVAMALEKLLRVYYFSSGLAASEFSMFEADMAYHDLFTLPLISTDALNFYSAGMEEHRQEKVSAIADWPYARKHLQVCTMSAEDNCGRCSKCIRSMSELYTIGRLDEFDAVFPVQNFKEHLAQRLGYVLAEAYGGHVFERDIVSQIKKNGKTIPVSAYVLAPYYVVREFFRVRLQAVKWVRRIYRKFHLDKLLYGRATNNGSWADQEAGIR